MAFRESVYGIVKGIPAGKVMSYSGVAGRSGSPGACRAVGTIMARNPVPGCGPGKVPCHRVVKADGSLGGYSGEGRTEGKKALLEKEGVRFSGKRVEKTCFV